jgi:hypothetical protein
MKLQTSYEQNQHNIIESISIVLKMYSQVRLSFNDIFQDHLVRVFPKVITIIIIQYVLKTQLLIIIICTNSS